MNRDVHRAGPRHTLAVQSYSGLGHARARLKRSRPMPIHLVNRTGPVLVMPGLFNPFSYFLTFLGEDHILLNVKYIRAGLGFERFAT